MALFDSYYPCEWRIPDDENHSWLRLRPGARHDPPPTANLHLVTAWNPFGRPSSLGRNIAYREDMEYDVLAAGGSFIVGATLALDRSWAEETLVIEHFDDQTAARFAADHGQWIFWRWDRYGFHLLEWGWGALLESHSVELERLSKWPCPMSENSSVPCRLAGSAIPADQVAFERRRTALICTAGCDVCQGGALLMAPSDPDWDGGWPVPSRYADAQAPHLPAPGSWPRHGNVT